MFWRRKQATKQVEEVKNIHVMPDDFYGGKDPVVHYVKTEKTVENGQVLKTNAPVKQSAASLAHGVSQMQLPSFLHSKKFKIITVVVGSLVVIGLISWYYINQAKPKVVQPIIPKETVTPVSEVIEPAVEEVIEPVVPEVVPTTTEPIIEPEKKVGLEFPSILLADGPDLDSDSLTDLEEEMFGTDSGVWDTDSDGYYDGLEVFNLYNPKGIAPMKIIDSGLVKEYVNPVWSYRVYYPVGWAVASVDEKSSQVLFSALSGDYIEIWSEDLQAGEGFTDWFARQAKDQLYSDLQTFTNRFKEDGWKRKDDLVAYFVANSKVYVLVYHPGVTGDISFRHVFVVMEQSFRPSKTTVVIPEQEILPQVLEEATSTISEFATSTQEELI